MSSIDEAEIERYSRPNWVEVDAAAIESNIRNLRQRIGAGVALYAALKGNACGFDVAKAGTLVSSCGVDALCVVDMGDALRLRGAGITCPILLFSGMLFEKSVVENGFKHDLMLTVHDFESLDAIGRYGPEGSKIFIEFNVGGERLGFEPGEAAEVAARVKALCAVTTVGISAHMHVPGGPAAMDTVSWQFARFQRVLDQLGKAGLAYRHAMIASSKTLVLTNEMNLSGVDPGHLVFGLMPRADAQYGADMRMALLAVKSRIIHIAGITRTEHVGDAPFSVRPGMRIGVIPFGHSDGMARIHCGHVLVKGVRAPLVASPTAEHARIDLTEIASARVGDEVVIFGTQGDSKIDLAAVQSFRKGMRASDITRSISPRVPRVYVNR